METMKLYPPILTGTTPPFYATGENGTFLLKVPFSMNKIVGLNQVKGVKLKIRHANNDWLIHSNLDATTVKLSTETSYAIFDLTPQAESMIVGHYYKIQLAYVDQNNVVGYFSTISITKCTAKPTAAIVGLSTYGTNVDVTEYVGVYSNLADTSEKCYQYKFSLYDDTDVEVETSGWLIHNSNGDTRSDESTDRYILKYYVDPDHRYRLQYSCLTNNGLTVKSAMYALTGQTSIKPELDANLIATMDYDNGCVHLKLLENADMSFNPSDENGVYAGSFIISRSSNKENYKIWTRIATFRLRGQMMRGDVFADFTLEQGETYRYALQQYNSKGVYSSRMYAINATPGSEMLEEIKRTKELDTDEQALYYLQSLTQEDRLKYSACDIYSYFEDAFLFDGERQLRIRFNPKVSSFKTVLQDSKKNTLGSKYPFFFRNGTVAYKEFPISGLISYLMDENEYFMSRTNDLKMDRWWQDTTDIIDDNITYERRFKLAVLDWLNDGKPKLFRSPGEGNYLVRLTNVSLTPNDSLSRMIHTFNSTADELDEYTPDKLLTYGFLRVETQEPLELRFSTINFADKIRSMAMNLRPLGDINEPNDGLYNQAASDFEHLDLLNGCDCSYIRFEDCVPNQVWFTITQGETTSTHMVGATGQYEYTFDEPVSVLKVFFRSPVNNLDGVDRFTPTRPKGSVTIGLWTQQSSVFDTVSKITQRDIIDSPAAPILAEQHATDNYIAMITSDKNRLSQFYAMKFQLSDAIATVTSLEDFAQEWGFYLLRETPQRYAIYRSVNEASYNVDVQGTRNIQDLLNEGTIIQDLSTNKFYTVTLRKDEDNNIIHPTMDETHPLDPTLWFVEINETYNPEVTIQRGPTTERVQLTATQVCIDDEIIDLAQTGSFYTEKTNIQPKQLLWGCCVQPTFVYQLLTIDYKLEEDVNPDYDEHGQVRNMSLAQAKEIMEHEHMLYDANILQYQQITSADLNGKAVYTVVRQGLEADYDNESWHVWRGDHFERLSREERSSFTGSSIWKPVNYLDYRQNHTVVHYSENYLNAKQTFEQILKYELEQQEKETVLQNGD